MRQLARRVELLAFTAKASRANEPGSARSLDDRSVVVHGMMQTARKTRQEPWARVARLIEIHHAILVKLDPRWE